MSFQIPIFLAMASVLFIFMYFFSMNDCRTKKTAILSRNKEIRSWPVIDAVIKRVAYGIDYNFPFFDDHAASDKSINKSDFTYFSDDYDDVDVIGAIENKGILIEYEFVLDGEVMVSRSISPIYDQRNIDILWKVKPGDKVRVLINPKNSAECYLKSSSREAIERLASEAEYENGKYLVFSLISFSLALVFFA